MLMYLSQLLMSVHPETECKHNPNYLQHCQIHCWTHALSVQLLQNRLSIVNMTSLTKVSELNYQRKLMKLCN